MKRIIETKIKQNHANKILYIWLSDNFLYCTSYEWKQFIEQGLIKVNNLQIDPHYILQLNDVVSFNSESISEPFVNKDYTIIFEDADFLALDKPATLPCHPSGRYFNNTLLNLLNSEYKNIHIITRLDRETSGIVLCAKNKIAASKVCLQQRLKKSEADYPYKEYIVLVHGNFPKKLEAFGYLTKDTNSIIRKKRKFVLGDNIDFNNQDTESAKTNFTLITQKNNISLVSAYLITGRTHQIRATMHSLGYPIVGDKMYGLDENYFIKLTQNTLSIDDKKKLILDTQALHCSKLQFQNMNDEVITVESKAFWYELFIQNKMPF